MTESSLSPLLSTVDLTKNFGYRELLKGVRLELYPNRFALLMGKNGSGKSTLMKILCGLSQPTAGSVYFEGEKVEEIATRFRQSLGMISHASCFYSEMTALENLRFFAKLYRISSLEKKISNALARTGLEEFSDLLVGTFSSGMNKRLNIARLMILEPQLLLLDEPYTGLDAASVRFFNEYLREFKASGGTALIISHQIESCADLCDDFLMLEQGVIRESTAELAQKYQQRSFTN